MGQVLIWTSRKVDVVYLSLSISIFRKFSSQRGLSLIELAVSLGIISVMALAVTQYMDDVTTSSSGADYHSNRLILRESLRETLLSGDACTCNFRAVVLPNPIPVGASTNPADIPQLAINADPTSCASPIAETYLSTAMAISGYRARQIYFDRFSTYGTNRVLAHLNYEIESTRRILGPRILTDDILVVLNLSLDGSRIESCGTAASNLQLKLTLGGAGLPINNGGPFVYTFNSLAIPPTGRTVALMQIEVRRANNLRQMEFFESTNLALSNGNYHISTGVDGHIEQSTFLALIPVDNGSFGATLSCGGCTVTATLLARLPKPPEQVYFDQAISTVNETDVVTPSTVTVRLSEPSTGIVTVNYQLSAVPPLSPATVGADYQALAPGTLTFNPGQLSQTITLNIVGDNLSEPLENISLQILNVVGGAYTLGIATGHVLTIRDDD